MDLCVLYETIVSLDVSRGSRANQSLHLTRALLGYFYNAPHLGGVLFIAPPPPNSETTGPIFEIQKLCDSPGKLVCEKKNLDDLRVTDDVTTHRSGQIQNV